MTSDPIFRFSLLLGDDDAGVAAVRSRLGGQNYLEDRTTAQWPFRRGVIPLLTNAPVIWIRDLHLAFPAGQSGGTRLVLTQSTYQLQRWLDWLERMPGITVIADADGRALRRSSPEAFAGRGPWRHIAIVDGNQDVAAHQGPPDDSPRRERDGGGASCPTLPSTPRSRSRIPAAGSMPVATPATASQTMRPCNSPTPAHAWSCTCSMMRRAPWSVPQGWRRSGRQCTSNGASCCCAAKRQSARPPRSRPPRS